VITLLIFILILSVLVLFHEFGHYFVAKKNGVRVEEFGLGLPPKVFGKKIGETEYTFNALPFGGFVKLTGEDSTDQEATLLDPRSFAHKKPGQRAAILVAGVCMNLLLAGSIYYIFFLIKDFKTLSTPLIFDYKFKFGNERTVSTVITGLSDPSSITTSQVEPGDALIEVNGVPVRSVADIRASVKDSAGQPVTLTLMDLRKTNDNIKTITVSPIKDSDGNGILVLYLGKAVTLSYATPVERLFSGFMQTYNMLAYSNHVLANLFLVSVESRSVAPVSEGVSGPVGIYSVIGNILHLGGEQAFLSLLDFTALMSLSLAFLNIMPFPALDGGRLFFVIIEKIRGKRIHPSAEANVHKWGMIALLVLIAVVSVKDVINLF
jgi:regulator of sigma E protease